MLFQNLVLLATFEQGDYQYRQIRSHPHATAHSVMKHLCSPAKVAASLRSLSRTLPRGSGWGDKPWVVRDALICSFSAVPYSLTRARDVVRFANGGWPFEFWGINSAGTRTHRKNCSDKFAKLCFLLSREGERRPSQVTFSIYGMQKLRIRCLRNGLSAKSIM